mmetsp:Transcript_6000/g.9793  ORF Transcript_6000/g.9793 Transcript_6000/m.9793 type:complete len:200 (+) Transcript_6000:83-682(+)|eukprot:scaffold11171_cov139-Skeletonema_menzelii.AAC.1
MRVVSLPHVFVGFAASIVESAAIDVQLRDLQQTYQGIRAAEFANITSSIPSAAPTIHNNMSKTSAPSALPESIVEPSASDNSMSMSSFTASDSATIPDNSQQQEEESGIFGMSLFQTCAAVILVATILASIGHFGMKLLRYNRLREDNARDDVRLEDSLASFRSLPCASSSNVGHNIHLEDSMASFRSLPRTSVSNVGV